MPTPTVDIFRDVRNFIPSRNVAVTSMLVVSAPLNDCDSAVCIIDPSTTLLLIQEILTGFLAVLRFFRGASLEHRQ